MTNPCDINECTPAADIERYGCFKWFIFAALLGLGLLLLLLRGCGGDDAANAVATNTPVAAANTAVPADTAVPATEVPATEAPAATDVPAATNTPIPAPTEEPAMEEEVNLVAPTLTLGALSAGKILLDGTGTPGSFVDIFRDGAEIGSAEIDADGNWSFEADAEAGSTFSAIGRLADGTPTGESEEAIIEGDAMAEMAALAMSEEPSFDFDAGTFMLAGTGEPGMTVTIFLDGEPIGTTTIGSDGTWSYPGQISDIVPLDADGNPIAGEYLLTAQMMDSSGAMISEAPEVVPILIEGGDSGDSGDGEMAEEAGMLQVSFAGAADDSAGIGAAPAGAPAAALILDSSWSMTFPVDFTGVDTGPDTEESQRTTADDPNSRIAVAKDGLTEFVENTLPTGMSTALRVFGNLEGDLACQTDLMVPYGPLDRGTMVAAINEVDPQFNANTALAASLLAVRDDLAAASEQNRTIVLVTDGDETCGGDPEAAIAALAADGFDVQVNIIGFAVSDPELKARLEGWATAGNGQYYDAPDAETLASSLQSAFGISYTVTDSDGAEVGAGIIGGAPVELPAGSYTVTVSTNPEQTFEVEVAAGETAVVETE